MTFRKIALFTALLGFGYLLLGLYVTLSKSNVSLYAGAWEQTTNGYATRVTVEKDTEFCMCPAYECATMVEATLLATQTFWGWRRFQYFSDPAYPNLDRPKHLEKEWPRPIYATGRQEYCLKKLQGEALLITLEPGDRDLWLNIE